MVQSSKNMETIQKQIEYYLSDANLGRDKFFREQIQTNKEGWVSISHFQNCNKIKSMKVTGAEISEACQDSECVDVSKDNLKIRRKGNNALPEKMEMRKRDEKAGDKAQKKNSKDEDGQDEHDENGKVILTERDFSDP